MSSVIHNEQAENQELGSKISDELLMGQYAKGDITALEELISRYQKPLYSFLWRLNRSGATVDELFQETWLRVIKNASTFKKTKFKGWLFTIAHHLIIDNIRAQRGFLSLDKPSDYSDGTDSLGDTFPARGPSPDQTAARNDLKLAIANALAGLPREQQEVFVLRMEANMSFKEIADIQKTSTNTALSRMQYALTKMRTLLAPSHTGTER
jgi:RNA polymerase sigma-70 factor (ECF subfamily)